MIKAGCPHIFTLALYLFVFQLSMAQPCDSNGNGFAFYTQEDIDNFASHYPSCNTISGSLLIGPEIMNLNGLHPIVGIGGSLIIEDNPFIESFSGFDNLKEIGGDINIKNGTVLKNMTGFQNLKKIVGGLFIEDCNSLLDLSGLNSLDSIKGSLKLINNDNLRSITGLSSVDYFGHHISLINCGKIGNLEGLNGLNQVKGDLIISSNSELDSLKGLKFLINIDGSFTIINNPDLDILGKDEPGIKYGPFQLKQIEGDLIIENNDALKSFSGLNSISRIQGNFFIEDNETLSNLNHILGLKTVLGSIGIKNNPSLINLGGFEDLTNVGGIGIESNHSLISLFGLHNLISINGDFGIGSGNSSLKYISGGLEAPGSSIHRLLKLKYIGGSLNISETNALSLLGFYNLDSIGGNLNISRNNFINIVYDFANLKGIDGVLSFSYNSQLSEIQFSNLKKIGGLSLDNNRKLQGIWGLFNIEEIGIYGLKINEDNELLRNLQGLEKVTYIEGDIILYDSDLRDFSGLNSGGGLSNLDSIGGSLRLDLNRALFSFNGLSKLKSIGKDLFVHNSISLVNLAALSGLKIIGGAIDVAQNRFLTSLSGLQNIDHESITHLSLSSNNTLSECEVISICNYLVNDGIAEIAGNESNCSSRQKVIEACNTIGNEDIQTLSKLIISPNPLTDYFILRIDQHLQFEYELFNAFGQKVKGGSIYSNEKLDVPQLGLGTYFIRIELNGNHIHRRIVKN